MDNGEKRTGAGIGSAGGTRISERELIEYIREHYPDMDHLPYETTYGLAIRAMKASLPPYLLHHVIEGCEAVSYWVAAERPQSSQADIDRILDTLSDIARRLSELPDRRADAGISWSGNNVYGDRKSIQSVHDAIHKASQIPQFIDIIDRYYKGLPHLRHASVSLEGNDVRLGFQTREEAMAAVDEYAALVFGIVAAEREKG